ncbi:MAG TPA: cytochrome b/b6 domain-containing protein [Acidobacteriaceae bacterium]
MGTHAAHVPAERDGTSCRIGKLRIGVAVSLLFSSAILLQPVGRAQEASDCLTCHGSSVGLKNSQGKSISVNPSTHMKGPHASFGCLDCHAGAAAQTHTAKTASASCITCHADAAKALAGGVHTALGSANNSGTCIACHGTNNVAKAVAAPGLCSSCHEQEVKQYQASIHGSARQRGNGDVPTCQSCHGATHGALAATDAHSPVNKKNLPDTCGSCHSNAALASKYMFTEVRPVEAYRQSVHGRAIQLGNANAATCNDCHGTHDILPVSDPRSKIWKQNVASTCGQCHSNVYNTYAQSIHGQAVAKGVLQAATCTDCHSEHRILAPADPGSTVYMANVSQEACSRCHDDTQLNAGFGMPQDRVPTYNDSYHGLAAHEGRQTVANCASCHGVHNIYPSSDARSTVNRANLSKTCGRCHEDAGRRFAIGPVHVMSSGTPGGKVLALVKLFYLVVIPVTLGLMLLHNALDWRHKAIASLAHYRQTRGQVRLNFSERMQHGVLVVSFIVLVITGFALKYPHVFWAAPFVDWEHGHPVRGWIHRIAGVVLIGASVYHVVYLSIKKSGRRWLRDMIPDLRDAKEAAQTVEYNLGHGRELPHYRRFNYAEKAEYWALVWGTAVMAVTGVLLWLNDWILAHAPQPAAILSISTAIHFYEAILATLAILVWHIYAVVFDPDVYPVKWTFLTGRAPEHEVREGMEGSADRKPAAPPASGLPPPEVPPATHGAD